MNRSGPTIDGHPRHARGGPWRTTLLRVAAIAATLAVAFLVERIITGGLVVDLSQVDWAPSEERVGAAVLIVGSLLVAILAAIGAPGWRWAVIAWSAAAVVAGLVYLTGGHQSALLIVAGATCVGLLAVATARADA